MAVKIQLMSKTLFANSPVTVFTHKFKTRISCIGGNGEISDAALASELAAKVTRVKTHMVEAEEAMRKSRKILFGELCEYMGLKEDEAKHKWSKMSEDEKWVLVKGFVAEWGVHFHPLSARSAKEMVDEYLRQGNSPSNSTPPPPSPLFPGFKRIIGFP